MEGTQDLEGSIRREGDLLVGEGTAGMQMFDDTMLLAIDNTIKTSSIVRTVISTAVTAGIAFLAYKFDNLYIAATGGAMSTIAIQQGKQAVEACKKYAHTLDEVVSHGWNSREGLKEIDHRYL